MKRFVFGPVPSRRLGMSLGVDLVPPKTCTFDCVYCECGATTDLTCRRAEYVPVEEVLEELDEVLTAGPPPDWVTFSGAGEPLLHQGLGRVARWIRRTHPENRVALLTNSALLEDPEAAEDAREADLVVASLDAVTPAVIHRLNRPAEEWDPAGLVPGLVKFRKTFVKSLWIEIFLAGGINDSPGELAAIADAVALIRPDKVQINTLDRPGTENTVRPAGKEALVTALAVLPGAELIGACAAGARAPESDELREKLLATLSRRPMTRNDVALVMGMKKARAQDFLDALREEGLLIRERRARGTFYRAGK